MTKTGAVKTLGILAAGAGVGAAAALLYAPQSGKQTRRHLRRFTNHKLEQLEDLQDNVTSYVNEYVDEAKDAMLGCIVETRRVMDDGSASLNRSLSDIEKRFKGGLERLAVCAR